MTQTTAPKKPSTKKKTTKKAGGSKKTEAKPDAKAETAIAMPDPAPAPAATQELPEERLPNDIIKAKRRCKKLHAEWLELKQLAKQAKDAYESSRDHLDSLEDEYMPGATRPALFQDTAGSDAPKPEQAATAAEPEAEGGSEPEELTPWEELPVSTLKSCGLTDSIVAKLDKEHSIKTLGELSAAMPKVPGFKGFGQQKVTALTVAFEQFWARNKQYTQPAAEEKPEDGWTPEQETPEDKPDIQILTRDQVDELRAKHEGLTTEEYANNTTELNVAMKRVVNTSSGVYYDPEADVPHGGFVLEIEPKVYCVSFFKAETSD